MDGWMDGWIIIKGNVCARVGRGILYIEIASNNFADWTLGL
jgi:hypothetical protein